MKHIIIAPENGAPDALQAFVVPDTREAIELAVEALIQRLDEQDGDPDAELNGDELDCSFAEDDFCDHATAFPGPGCPISDPDACSAGDDHIVGGPSPDSCRAFPRSREEPGSEDDAEDGGDTELNGDEGDYGGEVDGI